LSYEKLNWNQRQEPEAFKPMTKNFMILYIEALKWVMTLGD